MNSFVVKTNKFINTEKELLVSITQLIVASFKLEGIVLNYDETYELVVKSTQNKNIKPLQA